jgi:hypothetical protein
MTHALNIVWNPSEGIDLGFYNSFHCLIVGLVHHEHEVRFSLKIRLFLYGLLY